jgi:hypothetical protein
MQQMLNGHVPVQALHIAADLGIPDLMADRAQTPDELASAIGAHGPSLYRLLRMLAGAGVFREGPDGRFDLTPLGMTLRSDVPGSLRDAALLNGRPAIWAAWGQLRRSIMTGESAFEHAHGESFYEYVARHPDVGGPYNRSMTRQSEQHNTAVVAGYDFSPFGTVVDVGGGQGSTLAAILQADPTVRGILFDLPHVVEHAAPLRAPGVAGRAEAVGGDMLAAVPAGGDCYLLKRVLLGESDETAATILRNCAEALGERGKVLVVEMVMQPGNEPSVSKAFDIRMLMLHRGGRVRTEAEFRRLFEAAGLRLARVVPTPSPNSVLEGVRS